MFERREPVPDDERGTPASRVGQGGLDLRLGLRVERRGGLVEDQDARVAQ